MERFKWVQKEKFGDITGDIVHLIKRKVYFSYLVGVARKKGERTREEKQVMC